MDRKYLRGTSENAETMGEWLGNWRKKKNHKEPRGNPDGKKKKTGKKSKAGRLETRSGKDLSPQF